jgi:hypothetical protein
VLQNSLISVTGVAGNYHVRIVEVLVVNCDERVG